MILLEKAWAKIHSSYANIVGGFISEALHDLTGAPIEMKFLEKIDNPDTLWKELLFAD